MESVSAWPTSGGAPPRGLACRAASRGRALLPEALDDCDDIFPLESEPLSLRQQVSSLRPDDASFRFARNRDTSSSAKLEHAFISEDAKRAQHRVAVDT